MKLVAVVIIFRLKTDTTQSQILFRSKGKGRIEYGTKVSNLGDWSNNKYQKDLKPFKVICTRNKGQMRIQFYITAIPSHQ